MRHSMRHDTGKFDRNPTIINKSRKFIETEGGSYDLFVGMSAAPLVDHFFPFCATF